MLNVEYCDVSGIDIEKSMKIVTKKRQEKVRRLKNENSQRESIGAELLLLSMFKSEFPDEPFPPKIHQNQGEKPYFEDYENLYFNLSHSNLYVACAISDNPVGVDIQYMKDFDKNLVSRFFTPDEQEFWQNSKSKKEAFYKIWTKKEALLKCLGAGLGKMATKSVFRAQDEGYKFQTKHFGNYILCVCSKI